MLCPNGGRTRRIDRRNVKTLHPDVSPRGYRPDKGTYQPENKTINGEDVRLFLNKARLEILVIVAYTRSCEEVSWNRGSVFQSTRHTLNIETLK